MTADQPLPTLLSQLIVAYTIEFDGVYEQRMPHFTTVGRLAGMGPHSVWLASMAMWSDFMRHVPDDGVAVADLAGWARQSIPSTRSNFGGMERWNYVRPAEQSGATMPHRPGFGSAKGVRDEWLVKPTPPGKRAQEIWSPLGAEIDMRWEERFGKETITALRTSLIKVPAASDGGLPHYLAMVGPQNGFASQIARAEGARHDAETNLSVLLSRVLLAFTLEYERDASLSLPLAANVVRALNEGPVRVSELTVLTGLAKQGVDGSLSVLSKRGLVVVEPAPNGGKGKVARLTDQGAAAADEHAQRVHALEKTWTRQLGAGVIDELRKSISAVFAHPTGLAETVTPHDGGWRTHKAYAERTAAFVADPSEALPRHPMVSHRGGYPDGA